MRSTGVKALAQRRKTEGALRAAFERLKSGSPICVPIWTRLTQNNVAREAGLSPSALRKERYPDLISEIQQYSLIVSDAPPKPVPKVSRDEAPKNMDLSRMLSLLAEVAELRKKVRELQTIIDRCNMESR